MPFTTANDISIYFEVCGEGPPLFLVCGLGQNHLSWGELVPILSEHFQVIQFDNRGVGQTEAPNEGYSIKMMAQDISAFMGSIGIESAHFMGESMGAAIILQLCIDHPDRVQKAVLSAPFAHFPETKKNTVRTQLKLLKDGIEFRRLVELNISWLLSNHFLSFPKNIEAYLNMMGSNPYPQTHEGRLGQADALLEFDIRKDLSKIPHELLLLIGEHDLAIPPFISREISKNTLNCSTHTFKEVGHLITYEVPEKSAKQAITFLTG